MKKIILFSLLFAVLCITTKAQSNLTTGLVAYYPFNGNANDESGNGNNGTVNGATLTTDRFGNVGKAYSFDGVNNNIVLNQPFLTGKFSLSVWLKVSSTQTGYHGSIFSNGLLHGNWGNGFHAYIEPNNEYLYFDKFPRAVGYGASQSINLSDNSFHNFVFVWNGLTGVNSAKIYKDGILIAIGDFPSNVINSTGNLMCGFATDGGVNFPFKGIMDDIRIYNRALTSDEVTQLYNSEKPATDLSSGLVAYYPFNGNANDESGNGNNGTVNGAVTLTTDKDRKANSAYEFPGLAFNYISVPHSSSLSTNEFTLSAMIFSDTDYEIGRAHV